MGIAQQAITNDYAIYNADCMEVLPTLKDNSIHVSVFSPAFPELYQYSNDPRDMSNCVTYQEGLDHLKFALEQVHRVTMPGRVMCVHCMDLKKGAKYQRDFPGDIIKLCEPIGFHFFTRITIWKDPWLIARRTRLRCLMHKMIVNDSSMCRNAGADYVLVFKKSGDNTTPIQHPHGLKEYAGEMPIPQHLVNEFQDFKGDQRKNRLSHWIWRRYAAPVWDDIRSGNLLPYKEARESDEEKHVCALQLDVIERCLTLWSNPGEKVLSPFMGVGSEIFTAVKMGRLGLGVELKPTYFRQALENIKHAKDKIETATLFDKSTEEITDDELERIEPDESGADESPE